MDPIFEGPQARIIFVLLLVGLLAVLLYRLFGDEVERMGEALAVASFLLAHFTFLVSGARLLYVGAASLYAGQPVGGPTFLGVAIGVGYIGFASYQGFGPGWKSAFKGTFAVLWALVEVLSVVITAAFIYAAGLALMNPDKYGDPELPVWGHVVVFAILILLSAIPLLLHAGVELYTRHRS
jgi:hypothetical protein